MDRGAHKQSVNLQARLKNSHLHNLFQTGLEQQLVSDVIQNITKLYIRKTVPFSGYEVRLGIAGVL